MEKQLRQLIFYKAVVDIPEADRLSFESVVLSRDSGTEAFRKINLFVRGRFDKLYVCQNYLTGWRHPDLNAANGFTVEFLQGFNATERAQGLQRLR